ncbi:sugar ABC transporter ATP-binding protein [Deinococcus marmoris]|uniref:Ribose ABC transport system, ATP-binding protein RbsA n=1 Tax=Deinococcus marmoris TaxID=249408 RepID=A0A1U7NSX2_9DEIO|nr:sugar ABC transporter ATP-binding protein [Deinococcus marmoris]OLV16010.1 Ribose ABC transport system, ATP-binding protein RbsA [Deinococcus marmoris]
MTAPSLPTPPLLELRGLTKIFGATRAVDDVTLSLNGGEVLALLGQNGAGKSTIIKMLAGVYTPSGGEILFRGQPLGSYGAAPPIAFIHQDLGLVDWMTVTENLSFGMKFPRRGLLVDWGAARRNAEAALERVGGGIRPDARIKSLSRTERALVAIARALAVQAEVLVLDEPTSSLPADDVEKLFGVLRRLRGDGVGMIYVSHRLDEVFRISDRVAVLRDGQLVGEGLTRDTTPESLVTQIVGRKLEQLYPRAATPAAGPPQLAVRALIPEGDQPVTFSIQPGEVLGITGLKGAGQVEVGRALFGLVPHSGEVRLGDQPTDTHSPGAAMQGGIGFVSANRREESLALPLSVRENFFMNPAVQGVSLTQRLSAATERPRALDWVTRYGVRPSDPEAPVETLSGGNQQKVVMGRWLEFGGKLLILEEPTLGVDVGSKADIYALLAGALERGLCVLLVSTDFEEIAGVAHRALVFDRGQVVRELSGADLTLEQLNLWAAGGAALGPPPPQQGGRGHAVS